MDVVFAVVPFADVARPAIGVSLLKAEITPMFSACVQYLNLDFAGVIGERLYRHFCNEVPSDSMAGEWFFADLAFPGQLPPEHEYAKKFLVPVTASDMLAEMDKARAQRRAFVDRSAERLLALKPKVVGFTTTFHQTCACLAIAKKIKESPNPPIIIFGGANCEGIMGLQLIQSFPWVDYVCTREGDVAVPEFLKRLLMDGDPSPIPGILRREVSSDVTYPAIVEDLDALPIPDYSDYFDQLASCPVASDIRVSLQIETARGCWWGAKHHCTFCGLNGDTMGFRSKSPARVLEELTFLRQRYGVTRIDSVDNILDLKYITHVFPELKRRGSDIEMFYEVKANLKLQQLSAMHEGGVRSIQPGIESFSDQVLTLMRKGVSGFQNIQLLRWSEEVGIVPAWNILAGFPGESPEEYEWTARLLPLLEHLEPPTGCSPIRLDRFSPLFTKAEEFGLRRVRPTHAYYYVFPLGRRELSKLAYFFDFDYADGHTTEEYLKGTIEAVFSWRNARFGNERPILNATLSEDGSIAVVDTRSCAVEAKHLLRGCDADVYLACDSVQGLPGLVRRFGESHAPEEIRASLQSLIDFKLAFSRGEHYLSLGVLRNRPANFLQSETSYAYAPKASHPHALLPVL